MTIEANVLEMMARLQEDVNANGPHGGDFSEGVKEKAIAAIMGGAAEWVAYMSMYAKTPNQLARLIPSDGTGNDPVKREARAYLVANAVCAPGTTGTLNETVFNRLDNPPVVE